MIAPENRSQGAGNSNTNVFLPDEGFLRGRDLIGGNGVHGDEGWVEGVCGGSP